MRSKDFAYAQKCIPKNTVFSKRKQLFDTFLFRFQIILNQKQQVKVKSLYCTEFFLLSFSQLSYKDDVLSYKVLSYKDDNINREIVVKMIKLVSIFLLAFSDIIAVSCEGKFSCFLTWFHMKFIQWFFEKNLRSLFLLISAFI